MGRGFRPRAAHSIKKNNSSYPPPPPWFKIVKLDLVAEDYDVSLCQRIIMGGGTPNILVGMCHTCLQK